MKKARMYSPFVGAVAGLFGSMVGVGGGIIMNPMLLNICRTIPQRVLTGTSLAAVFSTALAGSSTFASSSCVDIPSTVLISSSAMLFSPIGARLTAILDCNTLRACLGYFLFAAAPLVPLKAMLISSPDDDTVDKQDSSSSWIESIQEMPLGSVLKMLGIGAVAGTASGLLGIGGGTIVTPMLALTTTLDHSVVLGTSLTSMIPPAMTGIVSHYYLGNVDMRLAAGLILGTSIGGFVGSTCALKAPQGVLEGIFSLGMIFLGRKTLASVATK
ncbi:hypothetical protein PSENEW3_00003111 [Picochlorum sp. SENEW3]|nr:hypothetical protein PSENEW3_00003111 [Picochlorum sp. SENEW3]